jgi:hypothetical protein
MSIQAAIHEHATLEVDQVTDIEVAKVGALQSLLDSCHGVCFFVGEINHGEAYAIVSHALVYFQFWGEGAFHGEMHVAAISLYCYHAGSLFYYSGKHIILYFIWCKVNKLQPFTETLKK